MNIKSIVILSAMLLLGILEVNGQAIGHSIEGVTWLDFDDDGMESEQMLTRSLEDPIPKQTTIYPNPTTRLINIHIPYRIIAPLEITIYENTGRRIKPVFTQSNHKNQTWSISIDDLVSGVHHFRIKNKDKIEWFPFIKI